ncbi:hypothetical protein OAN61_00015 [bacterium]|nr:hypothetical protein [bacterium]
MYRLYLRVQLSIGLLHCWCVKLIVMLLQVTDFGMARAKAVKGGTSRHS